MDANHRASRRRSRALSASFPEVVAALGDQVVGYRLPVGGGCDLEDLGYEAGQVARDDRAVIQPSGDVIEDQLVHPVSDRIVTESRSQKRSDGDDLDPAPVPGFSDCCRGPARGAYVLVRAASRSAVRSEGQPKGHAARITYLVGKAHQGVEPLGIVGGEQVLPGRTIDQPGETLLRVEGDAP